MSKVFPIVFLQGDEGREVVDEIERTEGVVMHGPTDDTIRLAIDRLRDFETGDEQEGDDTAGSADRNADFDGYRLTWNAGLGYVGLARITPELRGLRAPDEMQNHPVSQYLADSWDGGDVWGSAMAEGFAVCDFVYFELDRADEIPAEMGYRPAGAGAPVNASAGDGDWNFRGLVEGFGAGAFTADDVVGYLPILNRFLDACKAAGLDY